MNIEKIKKVLTVFVTTVILVGIMFSSYFGYQYVAEKTKKEKTLQTERRIPVRTQKVERRTLESRLEVKADLYPNEKVEIKPKISGRIIRLSKDDGTNLSYCVAVKKGEVIALLDQDELKSKVATAKASFNTLSAAYEVAKVNSDEAKREYDRQEQLFKVGAGTSFAFDSAKTTLLRSQALLKQAEANRNQAEANLRQAEITLDETFIRAPFDGVVTNKYVALGSMVTISTPLVEITDLYTIKALMNVPQHNLKDLRSKSTPIKLTSDLWDAPVEGVINRIYPTVDATTRTAIVEMLATNVALDTCQCVWKFRIGSYVRASILLSTHPNEIAVPVDVLLREGRYFVFVVEGDRVRQQFVELGVRDGTYFEILSGLKGDEEIVVSGQTRLTDGALIRKLNTVPQS